MCTYNISIDDQLAAQAARTLSKGVSFQLWLQQKVVELLETQIHPQKKRVGDSRRGLTDEQLAQQLAKYPPLTEDDFPDLSTEDYVSFIQKRSGRVPRGIEKWL